MLMPASSRCGSSSSPATCVRVAWLFLFARSAQTMVAERLPHPSRKRESPLFGSYSPPRTTTQRTCTRFPSIGRLDWHFIGVSIGLLFTSFHLWRATQALHDHEQPPQPTKGEQSAAGNRWGGCRFQAFP